MITIKGFPIDAAITEEHTYDSEVTSYPVESGSDITDNVRTLPIEITIEGLVSDNPLERRLATRSSGLSLTKPSMVISIGNVRTLSVMSLPLSTG